VLFLSHSLTFDDALNYMRANRGHEADAALGWFILNGDMARFAASASTAAVGPLARAGRAGLASFGLAMRGFARLLLDAVAVAWSLLIAPFVGLGQGMSRMRGAASAPRASIFSFLEPAVYDVPARYGSRAMPPGAGNAAAAAYVGYAAGPGSGRAFAPLLPPPGSLYAAPAGGLV
jgi:hypothetical protein